MIVHLTPDVLRVLFTLKGSIVKRIALRCLMVTLLAALIVLVERHFPAFFYPVSATPFTLLGLSLWPRGRGWPGPTRSARTTCAMPSWVMLAGNVRGWLNGSRSVIGATACWNNGWWA